ncbi:MAG: hypothetical protein RBU21_03765 [FCB group bacterium]|jgi:hypothetical protein|nr:hypothetical protein [FCB group bacterium]
MNGLEEVSISSLSHLKNGAHQMIFGLCELEHMPLAAAQRPRYGTDYIRTVAQIVGLEITVGQFSGFMLALL